MLTTTPLAAWTLTAASTVPVALPDGGLAVTVPGCVHTDLMAAGLIPDPYLDLNETLTAWVSQADWTYSTTLPAIVAPHADVVFEGLDTVADLYLDDRLLGSVTDMHRTWRFPLGPGPAGRILQVRFRSKARAAAAAALAKGLASGYPQPFNAIRSMACSFGWDWGPMTITSGIWRPARVETWSTARLDEVRAAVSLVGGDGVLDIVAAAVGDLTGLDVVASCDGVTVTAAPGPLQLVVPRPAVWWPVGFGEQPLSDVTVELRRGDVVLDQRALRVGFRTVQWHRDPDAEGTPLVCRVNGVRVNQRGFSWIPDDAFPHRVTAARYRERLGQAVWAHANTVRVWGGGIFEDDAFYDACDELGLLVWQDCLFACYPYDEQPETVADVEAEVRQNLARIGHHASLALINGGNEVVWGAVDWWAELTDRPWGDGYFHDLLPWLVAEVTPHLTYLPNSPVSDAAATLGGHTVDVHPNSDDHGTTHLWDVWNERDWSAYRDHRPRFAAEFGWQAPPTWTTLVRAVHDDPLTPDSPGMAAHQKAFGGSLKLMRGLATHYRVPTDLRDWHWAMQLNQADAVSAGVEWLRSTAPRCAGQLVWQLNDCWPVVSWSAVDGDGRPKPVLYGLRRSFAPRLVTVQPDLAGLPELVCVNDSPDPWQVAGRALRLSYDGRELGRVAVRLTVEPALTGRLPLDGLGSPQRPAAELIVVEVTGADRAVAWYVEPRDSLLTPPDLYLEVTPTGAGYAVTLTAESLVRQATLLVDQLDPDACADSGLVTLLPGDQVTIGVRSPTVPTVDEVRAVLRTANDLVAGVTPPAADARPGGPARPLGRPAV